jgi:hypothetical protein
MKSLINNLIASIVFGWLMGVLVEPSDVPYLGVKVGCCAALGMFLFLPVAKRLWPGLYQSAEALHNAWDRRK